MRSPAVLRFLSISSMTFALASCGGSGEVVPAAPDAVYRVRGELIRVSEPDRREIFLRHEAIPDFRSEAGDLVGMDSMTMPFPLGEGVSIEGLAAGDRVEFVFEVRWRASREPMAVTSIEKLPEGTRLGFDPAEPDESAQAAEAGHSAHSTGPETAPSAAAPPKLSAQPPPPSPQ